MVLVTEDRTRRHVKNIQMRQCMKDIVKYNFLHRMVEKWNALNN
ncbi:hypothetical protein E2C01_002252 [Portunus trituberculatus]|uniref:Uncharacterized protein n=1 Tax=Portunus trituberculatus TaxID=210409 RepID=A0A5B7CMT1_PORTR|nr:hypothetical protein [Portunus trituberculatus]